MVKLWMVDQGKKRVWKVPGSTVTVGKGPGSQIRLDDEQCGDKHCIFEFSGGAWKVRLLDSTKTLHVNGEQCVEKELSDGDVVTVGNTELHFELEEVVETVVSPPRKPGIRGAGRTRTSSRRGSSRRRGAGEEEEPARVRRYRRREGLPTWATIVIGVSVAVVIGFILLKMIESTTTTNVEILLDDAVKLMKIGDFDKAREKIQQAQAKAPPEELAKVKAALADLEKQERMHKYQVAMENDFRVRIQKFEQAKAVRIQKTKYRIFDLLIRCEMYKQDYPDSPYIKQVEEIQRKYSGYVDMNNPKFEWLVSAVRYPYEKSQHHKKFYLSFRLLDLFKRRYPQFDNPAQLGKLEKETLKYANMYGKKEIGFAWDVINRRETHIPTINAEITDLKRMIKYVGLKEWEEKGKQMLEKLLEYRAKVAGR